MSRLAMQSSPKRSAEPSEPVRERIAGLAQFLSRASRSRRYTNLELERAARDLAAIKQRVSTREYLQTSCNPRNILTIPDRTDEIFRDLTFFWSVGKVWSQIFGQLGLRSRQRVLDLACGHFPKVELGLYYHGFEGEVLAVDPSRRALASALAFLDFFAVPFTTRASPRSLWTIGGEPFDFVTANHALDDLILAEFCRARGFNLDDAYMREQRYVEIWDEILRSETHSLRTIERVAGRLVKLVRPGGYAVLVDYPSFSHRTLRLRKIIGLVGRLQRELRISLQKQGFRAVIPFKTPKLVYDRLHVKREHCVCMRRQK